MLKNILIISVIINIILIFGIIKYNCENRVKVPGIYIKNTSPVAGHFERGKPVDRYYIENFLEEHKEYIKGHVLEMGHPEYINKFKDNVTSYDILDLSPEDNEATIVGDLQNTAKMPKNKFDAYILTQTLQYPYDIKSTLKSVYKMMKKNGAVLITVPLVSQICDDAPRYYESWRFTQYSLKRLLEDAGFEVKEVIGYGSEFSSTLYMQGIAVEDLKNINDLDYNNEHSPMLIAALAIKK